MSQNIDVDEFGQKMNLSSSENHKKNVYSVACTCNIIIYYSDEIVSVFNISETLLENKM